ncbi:hypothetical protein H0H93_001331, partial [Arthromyces matolae]
MCISCETGTAPAKLNDYQLRRDLEKRVNCPQVGAFNIPGGRAVLRLANNIASWASGSEQGPTADQLASNPQVQAAFQVARVIFLLEHGVDYRSIKTASMGRFLYWSKYYARN